ncbi:MAG: hypothetical protein ACI8SE_001206 [Bacteroidia bacterium]|jgi:hypothetical protein
MAQNLRFPFGQCNPPATITDSHVAEWIRDIELLPERLNNVLKNVTLEQLQWRYRPDGWSIKQVVRHCVDSHINSIIRFKLALTEDKPTIRPYDQDAWIKLADANLDEIADSLKILEGLHAKWTILLKSLSEDEQNRELIHPEHDAPPTIKYFTGLYAWHSNHHLGHVKQALASNGTYR